MNISFRLVENSVDLIEDAEIMPQPSTPPKVPLAFRVGVTGHRMNKLPEPPEKLAELRGVIRKVLESFIKNPLELIGGTPDSGYLSSEPRLLIISPLAEGADRLVAEEALSLGFELQCPFPFPREEYKKDFESEPSRKEFDRLVGHATSVAELDGSRQDSKQAYEAIGRAVLRHSDLLIAIWDGEEPELRGGTSQIIEEARRLNIPTIWICSQPPHDVQIIIGDRTVPPGSHGLVEYLRRELLLDEEQGRYRRCYFNEVQKKVSLVSGIFRVFVSVVQGKIPKLQWRIKSFIESTRSEWHALLLNRDAGVVDDGIRSVVPQIEARFLAHHAWADKLANLYGDQYRSAFTLTYALSGLAVASSMMYLILRTQWLFGLELFFIVVIIVVTLRSRAGDWHRKWLDYRYLAECLRYMRFLWPLGRRGPIAHVPAHHKDGDPRNTWVTWLSHAIERNAGLADKENNDAFLRAQQRVLVAEVQGQINYHSLVAKRFHIVHHRLHSLGYLLFGLTSVACVIHLFFHHEGIVESILIFSSAVFPAFGAACAGILSQGEFHRIEVRSRFMAAQLQDFNERLNAQDSLSAAELGNLAEGIAETMLTELVDWRVVYIRKPLDLPA